LFYQHIITTPPTSRLLVTITDFSSQHIITTPPTSRLLVTITDFSSLRARFILQGGYKAYHAYLPAGCTAGGYTPMLAQGHGRDVFEAERFLKLARQKPWKNHVAIEELSAVASNGK